MADVAVVLLDREGQVLAGEGLLLRDQAVKALPVVGQEALPSTPTLSRNRRQVASSRPPQKVLLSVSSGIYTGLSNS
jgi:hypothetical protein